jgi:hypothetical protein
LSSNLREASKINDLTTPQTSTLYQPNVPMSTVKCSVQDVLPLRGALRVAPATRMVKITTLLAFRRN